MAYIYKITNDINNKVYIGKINRCICTNSSVGRAADL